MKKILFLLLVQVIVFQTNAQFITPISGTYLKDFFIVNYSDVDTTSSIKDTYCGSKTYNGHEGTDFVIRDFKQMDSGVNVLAALNGTVIKVVDGKPDRNKTSIPALQLGNYVGIWHVINGKNYYTYYAHLKKGSIKVDSGDVVTTGTIIGEVGSSGNSSNPHLHFEVYSDYGLIDPFESNCKIARNKLMWNNPLTYDTALHVIKNGIIRGYPRLNDLVENPDDDTIIEFPTNNEHDSIITYWWQGTGIRKNDIITLNWYKPNNSLWFTFADTADRDYWFYYFYTYIYNPYLISTPDIGTWKAILYVNNTMVGSKNFIVKAPTNIKLNINNNEEFEWTKKGLKHSKPLIVNIYNTLGQKVETIEHTDNQMHFYESTQTGVHFFEIINNGKISYQKRFIE